jgi:hypothetical protein
MSRRLALQQSASGNGTAAAVRRCVGAAEGLQGRRIAVSRHIGRRGEISTGILQPCEPGNLRGESNDGNKGAALALSRKG